MRAIWFASMAEGTSHIANSLTSPDSQAMINACRQLGAVIEQKNNQLLIQGVAGLPTAPANTTIQCGNSGQVLRFCTAMAALCNQPIIFDGDESIRQRRPMQAVIDGVNQLKGHASSAHQNGLAPLTITGPCEAGQISISGQFAQPVTAMLMLATQLEGLTTINAQPLIEPSWVYLTLYWFDKLNIHYEEPEPGVFNVIGKQRIAAFDTSIPGDFSSAAFPLVAAIIHQQPLILSHLDSNDAQGDKKLVTLLQQMGIDLVIDQANNTISTTGKQIPRGGTYNIEDFNDALPIIAVLSCFADDTVKITGGANTQHKESNRIKAIATGLIQMGALIKVTDDGLIIHPGTLHAATVDSFNDHRIAMALAIAGTAVTTGETTVTNTSCIDKSYPDFADAMTQIGLTMTSYHHDAQRPCS